MAITSANQLELLQTAEAVAREKMIDPGLVVEAMEESLARAAKSRYGAEMDIRVSIDRKTGKALERLRTGDKAIVRCQFQYSPQFISPGAPLLFREGRAKGVGKVVQLYKEHQEEVYGPEEEEGEAVPGDKGKAAAGGGGGSARDPGAT